MFEKAIIPDVEVVKSSTYHCPTCDQKLLVEGFTATCPGHLRMYQICRHCWHLIDNIRVDNGEDGMCRVCYQLYGFIAFASGV